MPTPFTPLLGLQEDGILPGETRTLGSPALDAASVAVARGLVGKQVALVTISHASELPLLVQQRWASLCEVRGATDAGITFEAVARVKLASVRGLKPPYEAEVDPAPPLPVGATDLSTLAAAAHKVLAAVHAGARPPSHTADAGVRAALGALQRALCSAQDMVSLEPYPQAEALERLAVLLTQRAPALKASVTLESAVTELSRHPAEIPRELRQRLWDQTVEILRRLDVYDPGTGSDEDDLTRLQRRLQQAGLPREAREVARRELRTMRAMETRHHDFPTYRGHLDFMARLPWHPEVLPPPDLGAVAAALDREHSALGKPKQRVLEYLAVRALGGQARSTILCLAGPPGVGKTTIASAVASALGRRFVRVALGGVHDESELRGHRLTYTAAAPGRILQGLATCGSCAPVMLLDEIDKLGTDRQRSPVGALHEVLDPEQNTHFHDNFLGVPFDLSHVLFICTANDLGSIHPTLLDRLEVVELDGYHAHEKVDIVRRHLLMRLQKESGLPQALQVEDAALALILEGHTRESGVRQLRRQLDALHRARALTRVRDGTAEVLGPVTPDEVHAVLGPRRYTRAARLPQLPPGVAVGLSVGTDGGALIHVEAALVPGKGTLHLTGRLGEVMQESAQLVLAHLRAHATRYRLDAAALAQDVHVHVPEGAIPKDGPSAGTALLAALVSVARQRPVPAEVAMTGELTLTGRVLAVGGVRAKVLAAERAGVRQVLVPADNAADVPPGVKVEVGLVTTASEVLAALWPDPAPAGGQTG